jgi:UDP-glucose 4-epimerase
MALAVQELFGNTGIRIIGTRHGEKLFETLMTREERLRAEDMGDYFRVRADTRDLNYDKFIVEGKVETMADEAYTSHNTKRLDLPGPHKTLEDYFIAFVMEKNREKQENDTAAKI